MSLVKVEIDSFYHTAPRKAAIFYLNIGHLYTHMFMMLYPASILFINITFDLSYSQMISYATISFACAAIGTLPSGWLADSWGRERLIIVFFIGIGAGAILVGTAISIIQLTIGLAVIGFSASIYHPVGIALITLQTPRSLGKALGINGVYGNIGIASASAIAGILSTYINWRSVFILPGIISVITGLFYWRLVNKLDCTQAIKASKESTKSPRNTNSFLKREQIQIIILLGMITLMSGILFNSIIIALPKIFDDRLNIVSSASTGIVLAIILASASFSQILSGHLVDRFGLKLIFICFSVLRIPFIYMSITAEGITMIATTWILMFLVFAEIPILDLILARTIPAKLRSRGFALIYLLGIGVSIGAAPLVSSVYAETHGFGLLFIYSFFFALGILICAALLPIGVNSVKDERVGR